MLRSRYLISVVCFFYLVIIEIASTYTGSKTIEAQELQSVLHRQPDVSGPMSFLAIEASLLSAFWSMESMFRRQDELREPDIKQQYAEPKAPNPAGSITINWLNQDSSTTFRLEFQQKPLNASEFQKKEVSVNRLQWRRADSKESKIKTTTRNMSLIPIANGSYDITLKENHELLSVVLPGNQCLFALTNLQIKDEADVSMVCDSHLEPFLHLPGTVLLEQDISGNWYIVIRHPDGNTLRTLLSEFTLRRSLNFNILLEVELDGRPDGVHGPHVNRYLVRRCPVNSEESSEDDSSNDGERYRRKRQKADKSAGFKKAKMNDDRMWRSNKYNSDDDFISDDDSTDSIISTESESDLMIYCSVDELHKKAKQHAVSNEFTRLIEIIYDHKKEMAKQKNTICGRNFRNQYIDFSFEFNTQLMHVFNGLMVNQQPIENVVLDLFKYIELLVYYWLCSGDSVEIPEETPYLNDLYEWLYFTAEAERRQQHNYIVLLGLTIDYVLLLSRGIDEGIILDWRAFYLQGDSDNNKMALLNAHKFSPASSSNSIKSHRRDIYDSNEYLYPRFCEELQKSLNQGKRTSGLRHFISDVTDWKYLQEVDRILTLQREEKLTFKSIQDNIYREGGIHQGDLTVWLNKLKRRVESSIRSNDYTDSLMAQWLDWIDDFEWRNLKPFEEMRERHIKLEQDALKEESSERSSVQQYLMKALEALSSNST